MSDRHRRGNMSMPVTSHVNGGGGNNNNRGGGGGGGGGGGNGSRRMVTPATAHVNPQQSMIPPPQWPAHSAAAMQQMQYTPNDFMYRYGQQAGGAAVVTHASHEMFAPTPYMPAADASMNRQLQRRFVPPPDPKEKTVVNSQAFMQFPVIYNLDAKPVVSCVPQLNSAQTQTFTTANKYNDTHVLLRRIVDCPLITAAHAQAVFEKLRHFRHPNLVKLNSITQTNEFILGSSDVVVEYKFVRNARALRDSLLSAPTRRDLSRSAEAATEGQLWSFAVQLIGLVRSFHELRAPIRGLHYSKMLYVEDTNRIMFTGLGLVDLVQGFNKGSLEEQFAEDIRAMGEVLLHLTTGSVERANHKEESTWERLPHISEAMRKLIEMCMGCTASGSYQSLTIHDICTLLASRISIEVGHQQGHADYLLHECSKSAENGRVMRLMMRLNMILALEEHQQETNDRYILRLFHQYVFHQVDDNGRARLDWGHIYHCLNKLDTGSDEIIQMVGTEHDMIIVASFEDIKHVLESAFRELEEDSQRGPDATAVGMVPTPASMMAGTPASMMMMGGTPASVLASQMGAAQMGGVVGTPSSLAQHASMRYGMPYH